MRALEMIQILSQLVKENGGDLDVVYKEDWREIRELELVFDEFDSVIEIRV